MCWNWHTTVPAAVSDYQLHEVTKQAIKSLERSVIEDTVNTLYQ